VKPKSQHFYIHFWRGGRESGKQYYLYAKSENIDNCWWPLSNVSAQVFIVTTFINVLVMIIFLLWVITSNDIYRSIVLNCSWLFVTLMVILVNTAVTTFSKLLNCWMCLIHIILRGIGLADFYRSINEKILMSLHLQLYAKIVFFKL